MKTCPYCAEQIQDAAVVCRFCNRNVSDAAPTAAPVPVTVVPPKRRTSVGTWIVAGLAVIVIGSCFNAVFNPPIPKTIPTPAGAAAAPKAPPAPPREQLTFSGSFNGTQIAVTNEGKTRWTKVTLDLNGGTFSDGYLYTFDALEPGKTVTVGALQFANSDGVRFNPFQMKPQKLQVTATIDGDIDVKTLRFR